MAPKFSTRYATPEAQALSPGEASAGTSAAMKSSVNGLRLAITFALSVVAVGSAAGQSFNDDIWMRANSQASRTRINNEILQARADGTIKRWAPTLIEVPLKSSRSRAYAPRDYPADTGSSNRATATTEPTLVARESRDTVLTVGE